MYGNVIIMHKILYLVTLSLCIHFKMLMLMSLFEFLFDYLIFVLIIM